MTMRKIFIGWVVSLLFCGQVLLAEETNKTTDATVELSDLITRINAKLSAGQQAESNFTENLKEFDVLLARHKAEQSPEAEMILMMKAQLYLQVFRDYAKTAEIVSQVKQNFPNTKLNIDEMVAALQPAIEKQKVRQRLVEGTMFPDFQVKDLNGKTISLSDFKGRIVLVDFWATWCVPCRMELPHVLTAYRKYHDRGFEIVGVSLDVDETQLKRFLEANEMTWPQYFDGKRYENELAVKYGVEAVPTTYLLDKSGKIIGRNLRGERLEAAVAGAVAK